MEVSARYQAAPEAESRSRCGELVEWLRDYAERRVNSRLIDERRTVPPYLVLDWGNRGLFGIQVEERYGGLALRNREVARVLEQAAAIDLGLGTFLLTSLFPGVRPIAAFGSDALKDAVLPDLAAGRMLAGYAQTESGAGTHFSAMDARIEVDGDRFRVSGEKVWIGNASWAGVLSVMAQEVEADGRRLGITALAIPTHLPGVAPGREMLSMGMRGMVQGEVAFRDVEVGPEHVLGERGQGLTVGVDSMSFSRFAIAATCVGALKRCAQVMRRFADRRQISTGRLAEHPVYVVSLAETAMRVAAAESILYRVADALDAGRAVAAELFAVCKLVGSEFLWETADTMVQTLGSRGYDEANLAPQLLRDARVTRIFEGTSEALLAFIGAATLAVNSPIVTILRDELSDAALADDLADAMAALRGREGISRPWRCHLAGHAAVWSLLAASLAAEPGELGEAGLEWVGAKLGRAFEEAAVGGVDERFLPAAAATEKVVARYVEAIGDTEQHLPGERLDFDPLLRR